LKILFALYSLLSMSFNLLREQKIFYKVTLVKRVNLNYLKAFVTFPFDEK